MYNCFAAFGNKFLYTKQLHGKCIILNMMCLLNKAHVNYSAVKVITHGQIYWSYRVEVVCI
jgi:hypothetical protein